MSSQAEGVRMAPSRRYSRRRGMLDLNVPPVIENRENEEGVSILFSTQGVQGSVQERYLSPTAIDVEALDDDVVESSATAFAQAKTNAQISHRRRARAVVVDVDVDSGSTSRLMPSNRNKRRRVPPNRTIINCETYINLETSGSHMTGNMYQAAPQPPSPPPPPPSQPTFNCPICMGPFVEETSTRCGHIFCKGCIKTAIAAQAKCPTCRKRVTAKELIRVYLPSTS